MISVRKVTVLVDNDSWILPYAVKLCDQLQRQHIEVTFARNQQDIAPGDLCFMLGCTRIVNEHNLAKNRNNLVVHESALPKGRGFAPMSWQILEGKNQIPISLLEAAESADEGKIWLTDTIELDGSELHHEWRALQGTKTVEMCLRFINEYVDITAVSQHGIPSYYPKRKQSDSELDIYKSIADQFDLLRIVDNQRYPAFFYINGCRYTLTIEKHRVDFSG